MIASKPAITALLVAAIVLTSPTQATARIVKCVDQSGKVTYTDGGCSAAQSGSRVTIISDNALDGTYLKDQARRLEQERAEQELSGPAVHVVPDNSATRPRHANTRQLPRDVTVPHKGAQHGQLTSDQRRALSEAMKSGDKEARKSLCQDALTDYTGRGLTASQKAAAAQCAGYDVQMPEPRPTSIAPAPPPPPAIITNCDQAGCWDSGGIRYNKGAGATHFPSNGGPACQLINGLMHCP